MRPTAANVGNKSVTSNFSDCLMSIAVDVMAAIVIDCGFQGYDNGEEYR
jgi:hypothetical protein